MNPEDENDFKKKLLIELRQVAAERPEPAPKPAKPRWTPATFALGGGGVAAAVAAVAIVAGGGGGATNAYAVETNPDGEVTVKITSLKDAGGLETKLIEAGVPAVVDYAPAATIECATPSELPEDLEEGKGAESLTARTVPAEAESVPATTAIRPVDPSAGPFGVRTHVGGGVAITLYMQNCRTSAGSPREHITPSCRRRRVPPARPHGLRRATADGHR
jgi:hypothetical protein